MMLWKFIPKQLEDETITPEEGEPYILNRTDRRHSTK
jgi:hypothetical protein